MGVSEQQDMVEQLYRELYQPMLVYASRLLQNHAQAEEAVQDTFRIACARYSEWKDSPNPPGWLFTTLKNVIRNQRRARQRLCQMLERLNNEDMPQQKNDEIELGLLYGNVADKASYQLLKRLAIDGYTMREVAEQEQISLESCKKRVQRARRELQKYFEKN